MENLCRNDYSSHDDGYQQQTYERMDIDTLKNPGDDSQGLILQTREMTKKPNISRMILKCPFRSFDAL